MRIAFVFPGQGSQSVGMLSGFAGNETVAGVMARADEALGFSLTGLIAEADEPPRLRCRSPRRNAFAHGQYPACDARLVGRLL